MQAAREFTLNRYEVRFTEEQNAAERICDLPAFLPPGAPLQIRLSAVRIRPSSRRYCAPPATTRGFGRALYSFDTFLNVRTSLTIGCLGPSKATPAQYWSASSLSLFHQFSPISSESRKGSAMKKGW